MLKGLPGTGGRRLRGLSVPSRNSTPLPSASTQALSGFKFKEIPFLLTGSQTREAAHSLWLLPWRMHSINRDPFSSSCINILGDEEINRSLFDLLLATQKSGLLCPRQDPHALPRHQNHEKYKMAGTATFLQGLLTWIGEPGGS